MKNTASVFISAAIALALCACDRSENVGVSSQASGGNSTAQGVPPDSDISSTPNASPKLTPLITETTAVSFENSCAYAAENGLYYLKEGLSDGSMIGGNLMYIDYATKQETYLCSDSSCRHNSERCTSYMRNSEAYYVTIGDPQLFVYNDSLYYLSIAMSNENSMSKQPSGSSMYRKQALYRMDPDGSDRQLVFTFDDKLIIEPFAAGDGNAVWFSVKTPVCEYNEKNDMYFYGSKDKSLIKIDLDDRSIVEQIPIGKLKDLTAVRVWDCSDSKVILKGQELPDGMTEQDVNDLYNDDLGEYSRRLHEINEKSKTVYYALDLTTKETKEIFRHGYTEEYTGFTDEKYAYFTNTEKPSAARVDLGSGEQSEFSPAKGYNVIGKLGGKYECISSDKNDNTVYFIDASSGKITSSALRSADDPEKSVIEDVISCGKEYALIYAGYKMPRTESSFYARFDYAVISLDDFFNGRANYEPVRMIGGD